MIMVIVVIISIIINIADKHRRQIKFLMWIGSSKVWTPSLQMKPDFRKKKLKQRVDLGVPGGWVLTLRPAGMKRAGCRAKLPEPVHPNYERFVGSS